MQAPFYETPDKGLHTEKEDMKPVGVLGIWWHETLRALAAIEELVSGLATSISATYQRVSIVLILSSPRLVLFTVHTSSVRYVSSDPAFFY